MTNPGQCEVLPAVNNNNLEEDSEEDSIGGGEAEYRAVEFNWAVNSVLLFICYTCDSNGI